MPDEPQKAAVNMHTLRDLRGNIPAFSYITDGKMHEVNALDIFIPEAGRQVHETVLRSNHWVDRAKGTQGLPAAPATHKFYDACADYHSALSFPVACRVMLYR